MKRAVTEPMIALAQQLTQGRATPSGDRFVVHPNDGGLHALQMNITVLIGIRTAPPPPAREVAR